MTSNNNNNENSNIEDQVESRELAPGVVLFKEYKRYTDNKDYVGIFIWKVQITTMSIVDFEVHLDQSENIELEDKEESELRTVNRIFPFQTKEVATVKLKNNWKLKSKFKLTMNVPDKDVQHTYIENDEIKLMNVVRAANTKLKNIPFEHLSKDEIEKILTSVNCQFVDLDFLPNDDAMVHPRYEESLKEIFDYIVHWRKPEDFCTGQVVNEIEKKEIKIFNYNEPEPNDIQQGILPDYNLASALSALAEKNNLVKRLFKSEGYSKQGIYQIKLCVAGEWITIYIDDFFPCIPMSNPIGSRSAGNELWVLILEKALAKVLESYYSLINVSISEFFMMLTGCPTLYINVEDMLKTEGGVEGSLKKIKQFVVDKRYLIVAISKSVEVDPNIETSTELDDEMLTIPNFGYCILDVKDKFKNNLILLRKVWFDSKKEEKLKKHQEDIFKRNPLLEKEGSENTLYLTYEEFLKEFSYLSVCFTKNWEEVRIRGKFILAKEQESLQESVLSKWYYTVQIDRPTNLIIGLHQDEDRVKENESRKQLMDISLSILKQDNNANEITHVDGIDFTLASNIQLEVSLPPGNYIILPRTTGCFFGRPYFKKNVDTVPLYNYEDKKFTPIFLATIKDIFKKFDLLLNRKLSYNEFKGFWECVNSYSISEMEFEGLLKKYCDYEKGLTERGFIDFFEDSYLNEGEKVIRSWLEYLGYDTELYPLRSRCFMLTLHADNPVSVSVRDALSTDLNTKVNKIILKSLGEEKVNNKNNIDVFTVEYYSKSNNVVSIGILNKTVLPFRITLDFTNSKNLLFTSKSPKIEKVVNPGQYEFFLHYFLLVDEYGSKVENTGYEVLINPIK